MQRKNRFDIGHGALCFNYVDFKRSCESSQNVVIFPEGQGSKFEGEKKQYDSSKSWKGCSMPHSDDMPCFRSLSALQVFGAGCCKGSGD